MHTEGIQAQAREMIHVFLYGLFRVYVKRFMRAVGKSEGCGVVDAEKSSFGIVACPSHHAVLIYINKRLIFR